MGGSERPDRDRGVGVTGSPILAEPSTPGVIQDFVDGYLVPVDPMDDLQVQLDESYAGSRPSFAYQLNALVAAVARGDRVVTDPDDGVANLQAIDAVYRAAGLPVRQSFAMLE